MQLGRKVFVLTRIRSRSGARTALLVGALFAVTAVAGCGSGQTLGTSVPSSVAVPASVSVPAVTDLGKVGGTSQATAVSGNIVIGASLGGPPDAVAWNLAPNG